jgi:hypothetical protein
MITAITRAKVARSLRALLALLTLAGMLLSSFGSAFAAEQLPVIEVRLEAAGRADKPDSGDTIMFEVPEGYALSGAKIAGRRKEGHPEHGCRPETDDADVHPHCNQRQPNEELRGILNGDEIFFLKDQNPRDDQWIDFEVHDISLARGENELYIVHSFKPGGPGSVELEGTLYIYPEQVPDPPSCGALETDRSELKLGEVVTLTARGENARAYRFLLDGTPVQEGASASYAFTASQVGSFTVSVEMQDAAGAWHAAAGCVQTLTVTADETFECYALQSARQAMLLGEANILTARGSEGVRGYRFLVNGELLYEGARDSFEFRPEAAGSYQISVQIQDAEGVWHEAAGCTALIEVRERSEPACIALTADKIALTLGEAAALSAQATPDTQAFRFLIDGVAVEENSRGSLRFAPSAVGTYAITVEAQGGDGQWRGGANCAQTITVGEQHIPDMPECIALMASEVLVKPHQRATLTAQGEDPQAYRFLLKGQVVQEGASASYEFSSPKSGSFTIAAEVLGEDGIWRGGVQCTAIIHVDDDEDHEDLNPTLEFETWVDCYNRYFRVPNVKKGVLDYALPVGVDFWYVIKGDPRDPNQTVEIVRVNEGLGFEETNLTIVIPRFVSERDVDIEAHYSGYQAGRRFNKQRQLYNLPGYTQEQIASCQRATLTCESGIFVEATQPIAWWDQVNRERLNESHGVAQVLKANGFWHGDVTLGWGGYTDDGRPRWYTGRLEWYEGQGNYSIHGFVGKRAEDIQAAHSLPLAGYAAQVGRCEMPIIPPPPPPPYTTTGEVLPYEPTAALGRSAEAVAHETGDWLRIGDLYLSLHESCAADAEERLVLPETGATLCAGNIRMHRLQGRWMGFGEGTSVTLSLGGQQSEWVLSGRHFRGYDQRLEQQDGYTLGSCYQDAAGNWVGVEVYRLVPVGA